MYLQAARAEGLLQYLLSAFLASGPQRQVVELPRARGRASAAACFCHQRPLQVGFVCSVCLSVFCSAVPRCATCGAEFGTGP